MACDICGKTGCNLVPLRDCYQTNDIKDICKDCEIVVSDHLHKIKKLSMTITEKLFIKFLKNKKSKSL